MNNTMPQFEPIKRSTMDVKETAKYLGVSVDMVRLLVREKRISHFRIGRRILFKKDKLDRWIESQMIEGAENE